MEEEEQNRYVAQLKEEFDSCDTTGTGYLDKEELTVLCHKLHLDAHIPVLLGNLLGPHPFGRVNFEEFKEGFVAVLANSLDLSTSEEESSYLEPVVPEEVKPKFVKGTKRYGRRTRPDRPDPELGVRLEGTSSLRTDQAKSSPVDEQRAKLRRSTSLESVESLKSDDGAGSNKESSPHTFEAQGQLKRWKRDSVGSSWHTPDLQSDGSDQQMQALWANLGVGGSSFLNRQELSLVCESIGLKDLPTEELDALFRKLDQDQDGRVSLKEFQRGFLTHGILPRPSSCSTPIHPHPHPLHSQSFADSPVRSASRSLLSATVGQRLLTRLDDGSGCGSPECVVALWNEEGVKNSQEILQTLEFSLEEKLSLAELSLALDNELLVSGNSIHQAALVSYKNEIQFLQVQADQARRERDKAKLDLERAEQRNLYLVREVDDRHTTMESFNETRIRGLEQEYRDKLMSLRTESEMEREVLLQQAEQERTRLQREVDSLRVKEVNLQEEISAANEENSRLEKEVSLLRGRLSDSETTISRLQKDLDHLLLDKLGLLDTGHEGLLGQEERFADIIREYEQQCRELRDRNDELNSELEVLKSQGLGTRSRKDRISTGAWPSLQEQMMESDSDDPEKKKKGAPLITRKKLPVTNTDALGSLESLPGNMSINSELFVELLKEKHNQEVQELKIDLETKVNFYERSLELMRRNMEVERKDISQGFKLEISELEEQKALAEEREARLRESLVQLQAQFQASAWGPEQEKRAQRERAELEQNYAREISNLVQKLTSEKEQLEAELKLKMDQEVQLVRRQLTEVTTENTVLKNRHSRVQQDIERLEDEVSKKRKNLEEMEKEHEKSREEVERLYKENARHREEVLELSGRNLELSGENAELMRSLRSDQEAVRLLTERLEQLSQEREEELVAVSELRESLNQQEREKEQLEHKLGAAKEKLHQLSAAEAELSGLTLKYRWQEEEKKRLLKEADERTLKVEQLQESLCSLNTQTEQLRSQLHAANLDKALQAQEATTCQKTLQEFEDKVQELESSVERMRQGKEQLRVAHQQQQQMEEEAEALRRECQSLRSQNQELFCKVSQLKVQECEVHKVNQESHTLKTKQAKLEIDVQQAQEQRLQADTALALAQSQHARELQQLREQLDQGWRERLCQIEARLAEEHRRVEQLEGQLNHQAHQASTHMGLQQEQYEKAMKWMEEKMEEADAKVKNLRMVLQEKVIQLKEQLSKNAKLDVLLKDLYVENSQLMKAVQVTEQRQKCAERKNYILEEKIAALNILLRKIAPASLSV